MLATLGIETEPKAVGMERNISDIKLSFKAFGDLALTDSDKVRICFLPGAVQRLKAFHLRLNDNQS